MGMRVDHTSDIEMNQARALVQEQGISEASEEFIQAMTPSIIKLQRAGLFEQNSLSLLYFLYSLGQDHGLRINKIIRTLETFNILTESNFETCIAPGHERIKNIFDEMSYLEQITFGLQLPCTIPITQEKLNKMLQEIENKEPPPVKGAILF